MKPRNPSLRRAARSSNLLGLCSITFTLLTAGQSMAQLTWTGATDTAWSNSSNWTDGANPGVPANGTVLNFGGATYGAPVNLPTNNDISDLTTGAINFTSNGTAGQTAAFTLGTAGQSIILGGTITTTNITGTAITDIINLNLILNAERTISTGTSHSVTINGIISETGGARNLIKGGGGSSATLTLTGNNTYTGSTIIQTGTLSVSKIADAGSGLDSNMGYGTKFLLGNFNGAATLNYTGSGNTTARTLDVSNGTGSNNNGGANITQNGANGGTGLVFSATNFTNIVATGPTARTLTLGGTNTDANQISGIIANVDGDTVLNLTKSGVGSWILAGDNAYTGINTITAGTLQVNRATNGLGNSTAANAISLNGGTLSLRNNGSGNSGAITYGSTNNVAGYNVQIAATSTINVDNLTANTGNTIKLNALSQSGTGARTLNLTGANGYSLEFASLALVAGAGQTTTLNPTTANLVITGNVTNPMSGFDPLPPSNFDTLTLGGTSTGNRIDGAISDAVGGVLGEGDTRITKNGASIWVLNGINTYVGPTSITAGTLLLNGNSPLATGAVSVSGGTLGGSGTLGGAVTVLAAGSLAPGNAAVGTLTLNSSLDVAAQAAGTGKLNFELGPIAASDKIAVAGALTIGPATPAPGVLGFSDFAFSGFTGLQNGTYKLITGATSVVGSLDAGNLSGTLGAGPAQGALQFTGTDLELVVTGVSGGGDPYETWAGGPGVNFDADANNDGVDNGLAWLLGAANPNVSALDKLPVVTQTGGALKLTFDMLPASARDGANLYLERSTNLASWTTGVLVPDATGGTAPVTFTVSGTNPLDVEATISSSEALAGKLFGRLKAER